MMKFSILLTLLLFSKGSLSAVITLSGDSTIMEGMNMVLTCTVDAVQTSRSIVVALVVDATSTAENGFDTVDVSTYRCVIFAGSMSGTVSMATFIDEQIETGAENMVVHGTVASPDTVAVAKVTFSITHVAGMTGDGNVYLRPQCDTNLVGTEGGTISLTINYVDSLGAPVPLETNYALTLAFFDDTATSATGAGGAPDDFNDTPGVGNLMGSTMGVGVVSGTVSIPLVQDTLIENAERFRFMLMTPTPPVAGVVLDTGVVCTGIIYDDDKPGFHVLNPNATLPRASKRTVPQIVFTVGTNTGIDLKMAPYETDVCRRNLAGYNGIHFRFPQPTRRTRTRITEYEFSATETVGAATFQQSTVSHIVITSRMGEKAKAPINTPIGSTITAYPSATANSDLLETPVTVALYMDNCDFWSQLRWSFTGNDGFENRLRKYKRKASITLTKKSEAGLYSVYRLGRGNKGWVQYVRVILSDCPKGMYHATPGMCDGGPITCQHGGIVDPEFTEGLCTCTPGYIGKFCEIPVDKGSFGHNGQFHVMNFPHLHSMNGGGVTFSFDHPFGNTCAAGYHGPGCVKKCMKGYFGAGCSFKCNCVDDICSETGVCANGCAGGATGDTCQG